VSSVWKIVTISIWSSKSVFTFKQQIGIFSFCFFRQDCVSVLILPSIVFFCIYDNCDWSKVNRHVPLKTTMAWSAFAAQVRNGRDFFQTTLIASLAFILADTKTA